MESSKRQAIPPAPSPFRRAASGPRSWASALLLAALSAGWPGAGLAHPGHGEETPWCSRDEPPETQGDSAVRLARVVLSRGTAGAAARMIARQAATSAEAALVLADALERLGDARGARLARERAASLPP